MAYKINGTTVVDNSRNVCACCVTSCCITASDRMDVPSGTTAQRPGSPATGSIYFDTDEGSLVSYNGADWSKVGGSSGVQFVGEVADGDPWTIGYMCILGERCRGQCGLDCWERRCWTINNSWYCYNPLNPGGFAADCCLCQLRLSYYNMFYNIPGTPCRIALCHPQSCTNLGNPPCSCYAWPGGQVFPDGSYCATVAKCESNSCLTRLFQRSVFINRKGGVSYSEDASTMGCIYCCCAEVSSSDFKALHYTGGGRNGPVPFMGYENICIIFNKYCNCCRSIANWGGTNWVLEVDTSTSGNPGFKVCCYTSFCRNTFRNPRELVLGTTVGTALNPCLIRICSKTCQYDCCIQLCSCQYCNMFDNFIIIPKEPTFSSSNPDCYNKIEDCDPSSGLKLKSNICFVPNSVLYARNNCNTGSGMFCKFGCGALGSQEIISDDGCYLYVIWSDRTCCTNSCPYCTCRCNDCISCPLCCIPYACGVPAVEKIDLTNGCVVCSLYFCEAYDCKVGNPNSVCPSISGINAASYLLSCPCGCEYQKGICVAGAKGNQNNIGFNQYACIVRPCSCPTLTYFTSPRTNNYGQIVIFNETDLNIYGNAAVNPYVGIGCAWRTMLEAFSGCCSGNPCWACLCTKVIDYISTQGCTARSSLSDTLFDLRMLGCPCPSCADVTPCLGPVTYRGLNLNSYINPYSNHLVTFYSLSSCITGLHWIGAVCHDLANDLCVSAVDTLWPTSGDFCLCALKVGVEYYQNGCWCGTEADIFKYECRPSALGYINCQPICFCCYGCRESMLDVQTYEAVNDDLGGLLIRQNCKFPSLNYDLGGICSSCRWCSICPTYPAAGYFGPACYGADIYNNTCNSCQYGLNRAHITAAVSSIPFCKPLCCSQMFDRLPKHKDLIEFFYGCHCLFRWYQALFFNSSCYEWAENCHLKAKEQNCMWCFSGKVDTTCQYTLGCICVWTWGTGYWCAKNRWIIADMATSCFQFDNAQCCVTYCLISESPLCFTCSCARLSTTCNYCQWVTFQCFITCDAYNRFQFCCCCYSQCCTWNPVQAACFIPCNKIGCNIIDNITDVVFGNCVTHSDALPFSPRYVSVIAPNSCTTYTTNTCTHPVNWDYHQTLAPTANTAFKGSAGMITEWFNRDYAMIC